MLSRPKRIDTRMTFENVIKDTSGMLCIVNSVCLCPQAAVVIKWPTKLDVRQGTSASNFNFPKVAISIPKTAPARGAPNAAPKPALMPLIISIFLSYTLTLKNLLTAEATLIPKEKLLWSQLLNQL